MRILSGVLLLTTAVWGGDQAFNGRWDITVTGRNDVAHWLELEGVGTPQAKGSFVSAYWGDLNPINEISVKDGELRFAFTENRRATGDERKINPPIVYTARLEKGRLVGTAPFQWTGVRAPEIKDHDDGSWKTGKPIELFNKKDLSGWEGRGHDDKPLGWVIEDGILKSAGGARNLITQAKFWNFDLHIEFRLAEHSNSGIGLRSRYEVQVLEDYGEPANSHGSGALYSRVTPTENAAKKAGEWQTYDIRLIGRDVTVVYNGKKVIDRKRIDGLTAIATDPDEGKPGPLILQGDHGSVEFRSIVLTPLHK